MKKHKSVVAILLAVMMIFTMMPTLAFAAESYPKTTWDKTTFNSVTVEQSATQSNTYTNVKKTWSHEDGLVTATLDWSNSKGIDSSGAAGYTPGQYYDIDFAEVTAPAKWSFDAFKAKYDADNKVTTDPDIKLAFSEPTYAKGATANTQKYNFPAAGANGLKATFSVAGFDPESFAQQTVTITATLLPSGSGEAANAAYAVLGTKTLTKEITVEAQKPAASMVKVYVDKVSANAVTGYNAAYDGKAHAFVTNEVPGYSVAWKKQNDTTKAWEAVDKAEFKDAGTYYFQCVITDTAKNTVAETRYFTATVTGNGANIVFTFSSDLDSARNVVEGTDPVEFIEASVEKADQETAMKLFNELYEVKATANKNDQVQVKWEIVAKEGVDAAKVLKGYKALTDNYSANIVANDSVHVYIVPEDSNFEVEFTKAPAKKVYHIKKAKKTKKAYSFSVKAEAANGAAVSYKLINANDKIKINRTTGKITVKKGLAKGTYKIKVKAYVPVVNGQVAGYAQETQAITIKVAK